MNWTQFAATGLMALAAALGFMLLTRLLTRFTRKLEKPRTYAQLKRDKDVSGFALYFAVIWVLGLSERVNMNASPDWSALLFALGVVAVGLCVRLILYWSASRESNDAGMDPQ